MLISCPISLSLPHSHKTQPQEKEKTKKRSKFSVSSFSTSMATYGSFHRIFETTAQNNSPKSLLDTLSSSSPWNLTKGLHITTHHDETPPFTEIFGELHFRESSSSSHSKSSLQLCTEGLGSESYYDLEDEKVNVKGEEDVDDEIETKVKDNGSSDGEEEWEPRRKELREYPPAMNRMSFKTYREEGRLVLEEVRIPRREFLRASREDGRLKLKLVQPEDDHDEEGENQNDKHEEDQ